MNIKSFSGAGGCFPAFLAVVAFAVGCADDQTVDEREAKERTQVLDYLHADQSLGRGVRLDWEQLVRTTTSGDSEQIRDTEVKFVSHGDLALEHLLDVAINAEASREERLMAAGYIDSLAQLSDSNVLALGAFTRLSKLRDEFSDSASSKIVTKAMLSALDNAIKRNPKNAILLFCRAQERYEAGQADPALVDLDRAISMEPTLVNALLLRGAIHTAQSNYELAVRDFTTAIGADPESVDAWELRAAAYGHLGRQAEAQADRAEAARLERSR